MSITPRWYQREAEQAFWDFLIAHPKKNPLIVFPTGAGKSISIGMIADRTVRAYGRRIIVIQHRKELIQQNAEKIKAFLSEVPIGIYSAGLKSRDTDQPVLLAGIQSIYNKAHEVGVRDLLLVDEAHLIPHDGEGMYQRFIGDLLKYNPHLRVGGLTATPFRTDHGPLCTPTTILNKVCYEVPIKRLIEEGHLCQLVTKTADNTVDVSKVTIRGHEYVNYELEACFSEEAKVKAACQEIVARTQDRNSVLIFCSGVDHAEKVALTISDMIRDVVGVVTAKTDPLIRASILGQFGCGAMKYLVNRDLLTTGNDIPRIDAIAVLRATLSPGLFAQIVGRGLRKHDRKKNCLVLDFGGNFERHGALDDPDYGRNSKHGGKTGEAPTKRCPACGEEVLLVTSQCPCGFEFPDRRRELKHDTKPDEDAEPFLTPKEPESWEVVRWSFAYHEKKQKAGEEKKPPTLRVDYWCKPLGAQDVIVETKISEWVCLEHDPVSWVYRKACRWWEQHTNYPVGDIQEAITLWTNDVFRMPQTITTSLDGKWPRIDSRTFADELPKVNVPVEELAAVAPCDDDIPF